MVPTGGEKVQSVPFPAAVAVPFGLPSSRMLTVDARVSAVTLKETVAVAVLETIGAAGCGKDGAVATSALIDGPAAPRPPISSTCLTRRVRPALPPHVAAAGTRTQARR